MSREKQNDEMAKIASKCMTKWLNNETPKALPDYIAEAFYNAGYRKQKEGEWKLQEGCNYLVMCTACGGFWASGRVAHFRSNTTFSH